MAEAGRLKGTKDGTISFDWWAVTDGVVRHTRGRVGEGALAVGGVPGRQPAILNALSDALGDDVYRRAPVTMDGILMALEHGRPMQDPFTAHI